MMADQLMLLPSATPSRVRLIRVPRDMAPLEAYRLVTGVIAALEAQGPSGTGDGPPGRQIPVDEIVDALEDQGFECLDLLLGPPLD